MNYFKTLGLDIDYKEKELDNNYKYLIDLMSPYIDDDFNLVNRFIDVDLAHDALKSNVKKYNLLATFYNNDREDISNAHKKFINSQFMIKNLEDNINKLVYITYNRDGQISRTSGYLESVHGFNFIKLMGQPKISFISCEEAIMNITNNQNKPIYVNPYIRYDYHIESEDELVMLYDKSWGDILGLAYYEINKINNQELTKKLTRNKK